LSEEEMTDHDVKSLMGGPHSLAHPWLEITNVKYNDRVTRNKLTRSIEDIVVVNIREII